ncbi:hypothetical protein TSAR_015540 [Trichomalopsis sarcophagae]|uniref:Uncharacterized protein n=1 Tax=Trichomalopsis sarcophagae TaxID=543379 RepID=A0A232EUG2_9HYME|nr:hypothetical protein TSAR_015540 [Trichomalopsis sarcophagae]
MHTVIYDSMYKHAVLTDFVLFKYNYTVSKVSLMHSKSPMMRGLFNYLETDCHISVYLTVLVRLFTLNPMASGSKNAACQYKLSCKISAL